MHQEEVISYFLLGHYLQLLNISHRPKIQTSVVNRTQIPNKITITLRFSFPHSVLKTYTNNKIWKKNICGIYCDNLPKSF